MLRMGAVRVASTSAASKAQIRINHFAVIQFQIFTIAEGLGTDDFTVFKGDVFTVPMQGIRLLQRCSDSDIFCVPESVLGFEYTVLKQGVGYVLKEYFPFICTSRK